MWPRAPRLFLQPAGASVPAGTRQVLSRCRQPLVWLSVVCCQKRFGIQSTDQDQAGMCFFILEVQLRLYTCMCTCMCAFCCPSCTQTACVCAAHPAHGQYESCCPQAMTHLPARSLWCVWATCPLGVVLVCGAWGHPLALCSFSSSLTQLRVLCGVQHCALQTVKQRTAVILWPLATPVVLCVHAVMM